LWIRIPVIPVTSAENLALIFLGFVAAFDRSFNSEWQEAILDLVELLKIEFPKTLKNGLWWYFICSWIEAHRQQLI
jgi:hypothetical protein